MFMKTFIANFNKAQFLAPLFMKHSLFIEIKPHHENSYYIELSSEGAKTLTYPPNHIDFLIEGELEDLEEVLLNHASLKQLIASGKVKIKGSYRHFLKFDAIIKLSAC
ncbi:SCP2 sterol-binding domain-containing protein [uncultured Metabacillus sp.]|uniref:SCP2 sterol-binding domain-containing protein n=1 Tax=uncultured Metabacillus sp. TaxID=2860135 RepID=UPI00262BE1D5|nr:SCP2 sterol-binding domain-containing protein [uncultured Metabacillus sp.]